MYQSLSVSVPEAFSDKVTFDKKGERERKREKEKEG